MSEAINPTVELILYPILATLIATLVLALVPNLGQLPFKWKLLLLAVVAGITFACAYIFTRVKNTEARMEAAQADNLGITVNAKSSELRFKFRMLLLSRGVTSVAISGMQATFSNLDLTPSGTPLPFSSGDFHCSTKGHDLQLPFSVAKDTPAELDCTLSGIFSRTSLYKFVSEGERKLTIDFVGVGKPVARVEYCVYLNPQLATEMQHASQDLTREFLFAECKGAK